MRRTKLALAILALGLTLAAPAAAADLPPAERPDEPVLTLKESLALALEQSPRVRIAGSVLRRSEAQRDELRSMLSPSITLNGGLDRGLVTNQSLGLNQPTTQAQVTLGYGQVIARSEPIRLSLELGDVGVRAAAFQEQSEKLAVLANVVSAYVAVLEAESALELSRIYARNSEAAARIAADRLDVGTATEADLLAAQAAEARARQGVSVAEDAVSLARDALLQTLGVDAEAVGGEGFRLEPIDTLATMFALDESLDTISARALRSRPEILQAELALEAARLKLQQYKADSRPQAEVRASFAGADGGPALSLTLTDRGQLSGGVTQTHTFDDHLADGGIPPNDRWQVGVGFRWNLADGGAKKARLAQLQEEVKEAELRLADVKSQLAVALAKQYSDVVHALQELAVADQELLEARTRYQAVERQLEAGTAAQIDLWQAEAQLVQARHDRVLALGRLIRAQASLAVASGLTAEELIGRED